MMESRDQKIDEKLLGCEYKFFFYFVWYPKVLFKSANSDYNDIYVLCDGGIHLLLHLLAFMPAIISHFDTELWHSELVLPAACKNSWVRWCGT